ncbi:FliH/SctL family protein [Tissierella creatinophila]|uniref:Flagellar assembly protein H n=1 Tax=Tissierella creatinophila DSM 6911 TaxID=1123403 RepID=A0A1U7M8W5_TISCR|nr:FliH/SctL family protein [Tissierella creatinophila]OLS03773.1 flagellar assembly protein H [Tissierella creatinophila DSM 6911]
MESSYKIIKRNYISSSDDEFFIDTAFEEIEEEKEDIDLYHEYIEETIGDEEKLKLLNDIDQYKKRVISEIESERKNILEIARIQAQKQAIEIREAAKEQGYDEGYARAIEDAKEEASIIKEKALDLIRETKEYRDNYLRENEKNIYNLAKTMSENIIDHIIDIEDENILLLIRPVLVEYLKEEDIIITSDARGKALLQKNRSKMEELCPNTRFIFLEDKSIDKNGFVIESEEQIVDLQIKVQLQNMLKEISDSDE